MNKPITLVDEATTKEIRRGFEYRLQPTEAQRDQFNLYARAYRFVFNWGLGEIKKVSEEWRERYKTAQDQGIEISKADRPKFPTTYELSNQLTVLKNQEGFTWLKGVYAQILQAALKDLDFAIKNFFRRVRNKEKPGFPRFKSQDHFQAFRFPQVKDKFVNQRYICVPKIGNVAYINTRPVKGHVKTMTIKRDGKHWFVSFSTVTIIPIIPPSEFPKAHIDLNIGITDKRISIVINDKQITTPTYYYDELIRLQNIGRSFSRKVKGSNNRLDCLARINKIHLKVRNRRKDFLHKLSHQIVSQFNTIVINKIPISTLVKDESIAMALTDCGWHSFVLMLKYKCDQRNKYFVETV